MINGRRKSSNDVAMTDAGGGVSAAGVTLCILGIRIFGGGSIRKKTCRNINDP
jgi:hypothetical protein